GPLVEADIALELVAGGRRIPAGVDRGIEVVALLRRHGGEAIVGRAGVGPDLALQVADAAVGVLIGGADAAAQVRVGDVVGLVDVVAGAGVGGGIAVQVAVGPAHAAHRAVIGAGVAGVAAGRGARAAGDAVALRPGAGDVGVALAGAAVGVRGA